MANMVRAVWLKAVAVIMRFRSAVALVFSRAVVRAPGRWAQESTSACRLPTVWQQLLDTAVQLRGHAREDAQGIGHYHTQHRLLANRVLVVRCA